MHIRRNNLPPNKAFVGLMMYFVVCVKEQMIYMVDMILGQTHISGSYKMFGIFMIFFSLFFCVWAGELMGVMYFQLARPNITIIMIIFLLQNFSTFE